MASSPAIIQQLRLELHTTSTQLGRQLSERSSQLFHAALQAVLAEELAAYAPSGQVLSLSRLVLQLEPVAADRFEQDMPERLRTALRAALAALLRTGHPAAKTDSADLVAVLGHFLLHGYLPWQLSAGGFSADAALQQALRQHPGALRDLLYQLGPMPTPRRRLAWQLKADTLNELIDFLEPIHAPVVCAYLRDTLDAHQRRPLVPASTPALRQVVYELVLADLLARRHTQFNRRQFVERQLRQLAAHYNLDFEDLLRQLTIALATDAPVPVGAPTLPSIIQSLLRQTQPLAAGTTQPAPALLTAPVLAATQVPNASTATTALTVPDEALVYYLRHGSLPPAWSQQFSRAAITAGLMAVWRAGRAALLRLAQAAGPEVTAAALLQHLPASAWPQVVETLAAGQQPTVLALLAELEAQAVHTSLAPADYPAKLRQLALRFLLTGTTGISTRQSLRQRLLRELPLPLPALGLMDDDSAQGQLFSYLLDGFATRPTLNTLAPAQLRRQLRALLAHGPTALIGFLHEHQANRPVLRHLAALADFAILTQLIPTGQRHRPAKRRARRGGSARLQLAALLVGPGPAPGSARHQLLREAYLLFHLHTRWEHSPPSLTIARQLAAAYHLPTKALKTYLLQQVQLAPALLEFPFIQWLLMAWGSPFSAALPVRSWQAKERQPIIARRSGSASFEETEDRALGGIQGESAEDPEEKPTAHVAGKNFSPAKNSTEIFRLDTGQSGSTRLLRSRQPAPQRAAALRPAWPATVAEAREIVFSYLLHGTHPNENHWLKPLLRWVLKRQSTAVFTFLRRYAAEAALWPRLAALADFGGLHHLFAGARGAGRSLSTTRAALAALDALDNGPSGSPRVLAFLKMAFLIQRQPSGGNSSLIALPQLAAAYGLPWRATIAKLARLQQRHPALATLPFFRQLLSKKLLGTTLTKSSAGAQGSSVNPLGRATSIGTPPSPAEGQPLSSPAASDLLYHFLQHGQAPWWQPVPVAADALRQTLRQLVRQRPRPLRDFVRRHAGDAAMRQHLTTLADFSLLHTLTATPGPGRSQRPQLRPALAALDRTLGQPTGGSSRFRLFLLEAYLGFAVAGAAADPLAPARRLAAAAGLSWRGVLARAARLLRQHPALAADPFFAALLRATLAHPATTRHLRLPPTQPKPKSTGSLAKSAPLEATWRLLEHYLQTGEQPLYIDLSAHLSQLLATNDQLWLAQMRPYLALPAARNRLAAIVPTGSFFALLRALFPATYQGLASPLRDWLRLLGQGLVRTGTAPAALWAEVLAVAASPDSPGTQAVALVESLLRLESGPAANSRTNKTLISRLLRAVAQKQVVLRGPLAALLAAQLPGVVAELRSSAPVSATPASAIQSTATTTPTTLRTKPLPPNPPPATTLYLTNSGLVLLWPFFTMLFDRLGYLEQRQFRSPEHAERAAQLLQFLVTGEENSPEHLLVLNKLLCGIDQTHPLPRDLPLTDTEKTTAEDLLKAALSRWSALKNTSIAGLRETFLQRAGKLEWLPERVALTVETKTVDILLDQLPWSISLIKLPWMALPLYVTWR